MKWREPDQLAAPGLVVVAGPIESIGRWRETGAVEDEARFLLQLVRAGGLPEERLGLAAFCRQAAAVEAFVRPPELGERRWLVGLKRWAPEIAVHAAVTAEAWLREQLGDPATSLHDAVSAWQASPSPATALGVAQALAVARARTPHIGAQRGVAPGEEIALLVLAPSAKRALAYIDRAIRIGGAGRRGQEQARVEVVGAIRTALARWALAAPPGGGAVSSSSGPRP